MRTRFISLFKQIVVPGAVLASGRATYRRRVLRPISRPLTGTARTTVCYRGPPDLASCLHSPTSLYYAPSMADIDEHGRPEPPLDGDEWETLTGFLDFQRATFAWKGAGLSASQLRQPLPPSAVTLGGLIKHLAWVRVLLADLAVSGLADEVGVTVVPRVFLDHWRILHWDTYSRDDR